MPVLALTIISAVAAVLIVVLLVELQKIPVRRFQKRIKALPPLTVTPETFRSLIGKTFVINKYNPKDPAKRARPSLLHPAQKYELHTRNTAALWNQYGDYHSMAIYALDPILNDRWHISNIVVLLPLEVKIIPDNV